MLCNEVKRFVYFFLDGALNEEKAATLQKHIDDCPGCCDRVAVHRRLRVFLRARLCIETAPESLRARVHAGLAELRMSAEAGMTDA
jgi:mycothiol system anti-sigma-R factor